MQLEALLKSKLKGFSSTGTSWYKSLCPFHHDTTPSFFINTDSGYWHCFGCGLKGWLQALLDRLNIRGTRATQLVTKHVRAPHRPPGEVNVLPEYILAVYKRCPRELLNAGFEKEVLREYEVGFDEENYRITFPIRDISGNLAAVSGRNLRGNPKYQIYTYSDVFPEYHPRPKDNLWNLHKLAKKLEHNKVKQLYLVEGYKACLWMIQHGYPAVASMGARMTENQLNLLAMYDIPLVLFLDNDEAGRAATVVNYLEISKRQFAKVVEYPDGTKQPDDLSEEVLNNVVGNPQEFRRWINGLQGQTQDFLRSLNRRR